MEIRLEPYDGAIATALVAALLRDLNDRYGPGDFPPLDPSLFAPPLGAFVVACAGDDPAGCGAFKRITPEVAEVKRMFVAPEHRRQGVGRIVLAALEELARGAGYSSLRLETGTLQPEAIALYAAAGFSPIPCFEPYDADPDSVCFAKGL